MKCLHCDKTTDLRPYGPRGAMVCFECTMSSPVRKIEAQHNYLLQLTAIKGPALLDGTEVGPYPLENHPDGKHLLTPTENK